MNKQANEYQFIAANKEFAAINNRLDAITKEVIPLSAICPQPLSGCVPVAIEPQTITTSAAGAQGVIIANPCSRAGDGK